MKEKTYLIRKFNKEKMIQEHLKAIDWHNCQILKIRSQINRLTDTYERNKE